MGLRFNVGNTRWLRGTRATYVIVGIAVVVMLGLLSVGGYALFTKLSHSNQPPVATSTRPAASPTKTMPAPTPTHTLVRPTPTLVLTRVASAENTPVRETSSPTVAIAQATPIPSRTPAPPTAASSAASTPGSTDPGTMAMPNTGLGLVPAALTAFGCLAAVSVARAARRRK